MIEQIIKKIPKGIKYIIWDVDGTLYPSSELTGKIVEEIYKNYVRKVYGINFKNAKEYFLLKKRVYKSSTITFLTLAIGPVFKNAEVFDKDFAVKIPIKENPKLLEVFEKLKAFEHYTLRNGTLKGTKIILSRLGLDKINWPGCEFGPFKKVWATLDTMGIPKPHPAVFEYVRTYLFFKEKTRFPKNEQEAKKFAQKILMIGDREEVDLEPARKMGMGTLLVKTFPLNLSL